MLTTSERGSLTTGSLFEIDVDQGPLYFASATVKHNLNLQANDFDSVSASEFFSGILYYVSNTIFPAQDLVQSRIMNASLKEHLKTLSCDNIWSSFSLLTEKKSFQQGFTLKFKRDSLESLDKYTKNVVKVAKTLGSTSISKLVPYNDQGFLVDVISCETEDRLDHFELLTVKYSSYRPSFDYDSSVFHSFEEIQNVLDLANNCTPNPEIENLKYLAKNYTNKPSSPALPEQRPHPFIVVEGLDAVGKSDVGNFCKFNNVLRKCTRFLFLYKSVA